MAIDLDGKSSRAHGLASRRDARLFGTIVRGIAIPAFLLIAALSSTPARAAVLSGELRKWHAVTLDFAGPTVSETSTPNPFFQYRLDVTFRHAASGRTVVVPGYFAADGNAGETGAVAGNVWRAIFTPDATGTWTWSASFRTGTNVAADDSPLAGTPLSPNGETGSFVIGSSNKTGRDFRRKGRLVDGGDGYPRWAEANDLALVGATGSPESFLGYWEFDNTYDRFGLASPHLIDGLHRYAVHVAHWKAGDPVWHGDKGKGIIGALNYLSSQNVNGVYIMINTVGGDARNCWPWTAHTQHVVYDASKLDQWLIVLAHAEKVGIQLHLVFGESENELLFQGDTPIGAERKIYYREMIARFGHLLSVTWNLGEEFGSVYNSTIGGASTDEQRKAWMSYIRATDPYDHPILVSSYPTRDYREAMYGPLIGYPDFNGPSAQIRFNEGINANVRLWRDRSATSGRPWLIAMDEVGGGNSASFEEPYPNHGRKYGLWASYLGGAWRYSEYAQRDLDFDTWGGDDNELEDFTKRASVWKQIRIARQFVEALPLTEMAPANDLTSATNDYVLAKTGALYAVYMPTGGGTNITLPAGMYDLRWFNPRTGGAEVVGEVSEVTGPGTRATGAPPSAPTDDWLAIFRLRTGSGGTAYALTTTVSGSGTIARNPDAANYAPGTVVALTATPASGWQFAGWSGSETGSENPVSVTMNANMAVTATFTQQTSGGQSVASFTLINAATDQDIGPLVNGQIIDFAALGTNALNVRANTSPATVGSVRFALDGNANFRTESGAPYSLAGDNAGNYANWTSSTGNHTLTATPYTGSGATGTAGTALSVAFTVGSGGGTPVSYTLAVNTTGSGTVQKSPDAASYAASTIVQLTANAASGWTFSSWSGDAAGAANPVNVTMDANKSVTATFAQQPAGSGQAVTSFTLVNADTEQDIGPLTDGMTINLAVLPTRNLNVRANTSPALVGSVRFALDANANFRTESGTPYALAGDNRGNYANWTPALGTRTLTATPYTGSNASGTPGAALTVAFTVVDDGLAVTSSPNPFNPSTEIRFFLPRQARVRVAVYNASGQRVRVLADGVIATGEHRIAFDATGLGSGLFFAVVTADGKRAIERMLLVR